MKLASPLRVIEVSKITKADFCTSPRLVQVKTKQNKKLLYMSNLGMWQLNSMGDKREA